MKEICFQFQPPLQSNPCTFYKIQRSFKQLYDQTHGFKYFPELVYFPLQVVIKRVHSRRKFLSTWKNYIQDFKRIWLTLPSQFFQRFYDCQFLQIKAENSQPFEMLTNDIEEEEFIGTINNHQIKDSSFHLTSTRSLNQIISQQQKQGHQEEIEKESIRKQNESNSQQREIKIEIFDKIEEATSKTVQNNQKERDEKRKANLFQDEVNDEKKNQLNDIQTRAAVFVNKLQNLIQHYLSIELFGGIASKMNNNLTRHKQLISIEEVMKFSAFLLSTGLQKMDEISEYLEPSSFGIQPLISQKVFLCILSTLQTKDIILKLSQILPKVSEDNSKSPQNNLILTNYLGLFEEFTFSLFGQQSQLGRSKDPRFNNFNSNFLLLKSKVDFDAHHQSSVVPNKVLSLISMGSNTQDLQQQNQLIFFFNSENLTLCDIQSRYSEINEQNENFIQQSQQNSQSSNCEKRLSLIYQPGDSTNSDNFIQNYQFILQSLTEEKKIFLENAIQSRPLKGVNLNDYECIGIRAFSEIIYAICMNIYDQIGRFLGQQLPFKNILNKVIENLMERANQISMNNKIQNNQIGKLSNQLPPQKIGLTLQRHHFIKTKHCSFCIVCQKNGKFTKSKYQCVVCQIKYGRGIALCISECDQLFHQDPFHYLNVILKVDRSRDGHKLKKKNMIISKIEDISVSDYLGQLENYSKAVSFITKALNPSKSILFEQVHLFKPSNKKIQSNDQINSKINSTENIDNLPLLNLKLEDVESVSLKFPPYFQAINEQFQSTVNSDRIKQRGRKRKIIKNQQHQGDSQNQRNEKNEDFLKQQNEKQLEKEDCKQDSSEGDKGHSIVDEESNEQQKSCEENKYSKHNLS